MASRALLKRTALNRMLSIVEERWISQGAREQDKPAILKDKLSLEEWNVITQNLHRQFRKHNFERAFSPAANLPHRRSARNH
jgi:hypothetical protein